MGAALGREMSYGRHFYTTIGVNAYHHLEWLYIKRHSKRIAENEMSRRAIAPALALILLAAQAWADEKEDVITGYLCPPVGTSLPNQCLITGKDGCPEWGSCNAGEGHDSKDARLVGGSHSQIGTAGSITLAPWRCPYIRGDGVAVWMECVYEHGFTELPNGESK